MRVASTSSLPESRIQKPSSECFDTDFEPFLGQFLAGEGRSKVAIASLVSPQDLGLELGIVLVVGWLAPQSVNNGRVASLFEFALDASDLSDAEFEQSCGFGLRSLAFQDRLHHLENVTFPLTHLDTIPVLYLDHLASSSA
jgi:hypothetical protein